MQAVANNPKFAKKVGVPQSVGREFTKAGGGEMKESKKMVGKELAFMKAKKAPKSMIKHEMAEAGMKKGGKVKKMAAGGLGGPSLAGISGGKMNLAKTITRQAMSKMNPPKNIARTAASKPAPTDMKSGGLASGHKAADGCATKGKTKGAQVKMAKGGMSKGCK